MKWRIDDEVICGHQHQRQPEHHGNKRAASSILDATESEHTRKQSCADERKSKEVVPRESQPREDVLHVRTILRRDLFADGRHHKQRRCSDPSGQRKPSESEGKFLHGRDCGESVRRGEGDEGGMQRGRTGLGIDYWSLVI